ncbi:hypothetical protein NLI96_g2982 [Meripilus lineatus]|uniref:RTA1-domain-containing protein n=1 Tax=Meripilus lineatus TaxID=2056292 RepID=A0AAD5V7N1_9APHY|nr:hypothetical protein NLI96_g2982 [Physisporinus lineatus]
MPSNSSAYGPDVIAPDGTILKSPYYEYIPTKWICIMFVGLYALTTILHFGQSLRYRMWFLLPTVCLAGVGEVIGWGGRSWSSFSPLLQTPFLIQIVATILAPTPFVAALFILFARLTNRLGIRYSRLSPQWYSRIFLSCDFVSLIIQGAGGGIAATANDSAGSNTGSKIMLGGILFQLISLIAFITLAAEYLWRYSQDRTVRRHRKTLESTESQTTLTYRFEWDTKIKLFICGLTFITTCILIRSIYRLIELADGWNGRIISTQVYFNVLDGGMILISMFALNVFHPGYFLDESQVPYSPMREKHATETTETLVPPV